LCPEAPQKTAKFSPSKEVLNTSGEYFLILSVMNFSGVPFLLAMVYIFQSFTYGRPSFSAWWKLGGNGHVFANAEDRERKREMLRITS
jgi:hypothetical protein